MSTENVDGASHTFWQAFAKSFDQHASEENKSALFVEVKPSRCSTQLALADEPHRLRVVEQSNYATTF